MVPQRVRDWLVQAGYGGVKTARPVGGGCINNGMQVQTERGESFFLKTNSHAPAELFARETEGLEELRLPGGQAVPGLPRVPHVFVHGADFLLLEDLAPAARQADYWPAFGRQLAALHNCCAPQFGFHHDNYIGSTPQPNPWTADGFEFFGEQRLLFQARLAQQRGLLGSGETAKVERLAARLPQLLPAQPASLLHGDLWTGNALSDAHGAPAIIDPAAHYGWAEAELAMTALFGSFPPAFYRAYLEVRPLETGFEGRYDVYNLYHLLNHLNLFGAGYLGQVASILRHYA